MRRIIISDKTAIALEKELSAWFEKESVSDSVLERAQTSLEKLRKIEKNLQRLAIEEGISFQDFRERRDEIEAEREKLKNLIESIKLLRNLVKADFELALNLAKQLGFLFEKGTFDEKRLLCETVFRRLHVCNRVITKTELNPPFALITARVGSSVSFQFGRPEGIRTSNLSQPV